MAEPQPAGTCKHCGLPLYKDQPLVTFPTGKVSHVACEIDARRQNRGG